MLHILVNFSHKETRLVEQSFSAELDNMVKNDFGHFTDSHYTLCRISYTELLITIDLCCIYSMQFANKVVDIASGIKGVMVSSVNFYL